MKKSIGLMLAVLLVLCMGTALADARQMTGGVVVDVQEDGTFTCKSPWEEAAVKVDENTVIETEDEIAPGMLVEVFFQPSEGMTMPEDVTALRVRDAIYIGMVEEVDKAGYRVFLNTASFGQVWVQLPKTTDMDDLESAFIAFRGYPIDGKSPLEEVEARDFTICEELNGQIAQVGDDYVEFDTAQGEQARVNLSSETALYYVPEEGRDAAVYYTEATGAEPLEVEAMAIVNSNG